MKKILYYEKKNKKILVNMQKIKHYLIIERDKYKIYTKK